MKQKNKGKAHLKERGPIWNLKIGIHSSVSENSIRAYEKTKKLKMKIILN